MANKRVRDNAALLYTGVASGDIFFIDDLDANEDKNITAAELKKYVLENGTIGGTTAGDIADIDSNQTLTNKRLNSPGINSATPVTADSAEINKLDGLTATTANLQLTATYAAKIPYLANVTSDIQNQINSIDLSAIARVWTYGVTFTAASSSYTITESALLTAVGLSPTGYVVDPTSMHGTTCEVSAGVYTVIDDTGAAAPNVQITWTTQTDNGQVHLTELKSSGLTPTNQYNIAFTFRVLEKAGV